MATNKILVFDMDGTIADFYGVNGWLDYLHESNPTPYVVAEPIWDTIKLNSYLNMLKAYGWTVVVTSWLANNSTKDYDRAVRQAKLDWLENMGFPYDEIHLVKYGTTKANCTRKHGGYQILIDDNDKVRKGWSLGETFNPMTDNLIEYLERLLIAEIG